MKIKDQCFLPNNFIIAIVLERIFVASFNSIPLVEKNLYPWFHGKPKGLY